VRHRRHQRLRTGSLCDDEVEIDNRLAGLAAPARAPRNGGLRFA
jgi:hypothetical protein